MISSKNRCMIIVNQIRICEHNGVVNLTQTQRHICQPPPSSPPPPQSPPYIHTQTCKHTQKHTQGVLSTTHPHIDQTMTKPLYFPLSLLCISLCISLSFVEISWAVGGMWAESLECGSEGGCQCPGIPHTALRGSTAISGPQVKLWPDSRHSLSLPLPFSGKHRCKYTYAPTHL